MAGVDLKIPTQALEVKLWTYPDGHVMGEIFLGLQGSEMRPEDPLKLLNDGGRFLVVRPRGGETRFYNKSAIVRMDYISMDAAPSWQAQGIPCTLSMIDGTALFGRLREGLTNEEQRLLDYLNRSQEPFMKLYGKDDTVSLVNKHYVVHAAQKPE